LEALQASRYVGILNGQWAVCPARVIEEVRPFCIGFDGAAVEEFPVQPFHLPPLYQSSGPQQSSKRKWLNQPEELSEMNWVVHRLDWDWDELALPEPARAGNALPQNEPAPFPAGF